ncbi:MAG TPA: hypothetical protein VJ398_02700 [Acidimicrobiia bacterium]|nr:hypothetical protein [Acidimicrobiia bacterium]
MTRVCLVTDDWSSEASRASTFIERFRGLRGEPDDAHLLLETSSVHTLGMARSIAIVMIDRDLRVIRTQALMPNRVVYERTARFVLELPKGSELPAVGSRVEIVDV